MIQDYGFQVIYSGRPRICENFCNGINCRRGILLVPAVSSLDVGDVFHLL